MCQIFSAFSRYIFQDLTVSDGQSSVYTLYSMHGCAHVMPYSTAQCLPAAESKTEISKVVQNNFQEKYASLVVKINFMAIVVGVFS